MITTHICAGTEESAAARAAAAEVPEGEWQRVGPEPADVAPPATGALLFASDWRDVFPIDPMALGVQDGGAAEFLAVAHANADLLVELAP